MSRTKHKDYPTTAPDWVIRVGVGHVSRTGYQLWACAVQTVAGLENIPLGTYQFHALERAESFSEDRLEALARLHFTSREALALMALVLFETKLSIRSIHGDCSENHENKTNPNPARQDVQTSVRDSD